MSHFGGVYLKRHGCVIVSVNPRETSILGSECYPSLTDIPGSVGLVDVFRAPDAVPEIAQQALDIGAGYLWLQYGVISEQGISLAEQGGLNVVVDWMSESGTWPVSWPDALVGVQNQRDLRTTP